MNSKLSNALEEITRNDSMGVAPNSNNLYFVLLVHEHSMQCVIE